MRSLLFSFLLISVGWCSSSDAALVYDVFFRVAGTDEIDTTLNIGPAGATFTGVEVVFRETLTDPGNDVAVFGNAPLSSVGVDINNAGGGDVANAQAVAALFLPAGALADANTIAAGSFITGLNATNVGGTGTVFEGVVGTVDLTVGAGETVVFSLADAQPGAAQSNFRTTASEIDDISLNFRMLTINSVTAVPEPSSFMVLGMIGMAAAVRRRRK